jgi:hypothetical protein
LTGSPFYFVFVDNQSSISKGTFKHPFNTLLAAQMNSAPGNVIYVFPGDGTTKGMNNGITLQNNQLLQGSGLPIIAQTNNGPMTIPAQTSSFPTIGNSIPGSGVVTLGNNDIVNGFNIISSGSSIVGTNITNTTITNNNFSMGSTYDILLTNLSGTTLIQNNRSLSAGGISVTSPNNFNLSILNNFFNNSLTLNSISITTEQNSLATILVNSNISTQSLGPVNIQLFDNSVATASIENNTFSNYSNVGVGIGITAFNNSAANLIINGNQLMESATSLAIPIQVSSLSSNNIIAQVMNNTATGGLPGSIGFDFVNRTNFSLRLVGNNSALGYILDNSAGLIFTVQSPNFALSGLGPPLNNVTPTTLGTITFDGLNPPVQ